MQIAWRVAVGVLVLAGADSAWANTFNLPSASRVECHSSSIACQPDNYAWTTATNAPPPTRVNAQLNRAYTNGKGGWAKIYPATTWSTEHWTGVTYQPSFTGAANIGTYFRGFFCT